MRQVMEQKRWSAYKWAQLAGTSPTNITRFLADSKHTPSASTIAKLSTVAGSSPSLSQHQIITNQSQVINVYNRMNEAESTMSVFGLKGDLKAYNLQQEFPSFGLNSSQLFVARPVKQYKKNNLLVVLMAGEVTVMKVTSEHKWFVNNDGDLHRASAVTVLGKIVQIITNLDD